MGKQAKLKAAKRAARQFQKEELAEQAAITTDTPPDLGVQAAEVIKTGDRFGG